MARTNVGAAAKTSTRKLEIAERRAEVLRLRKQRDPRLSIRDIANRLGVGRSTVYRDLMHEIGIAQVKRTMQAEKLIDIELRELESLLIEAKLHIEEGSETAIDRALKILESRRDLLGTDAAQKIDMSTAEVIIVDDIPRPSKKAEEPVE